MKKIILISCLLIFTNSYGEFKDWNSISDIPIAQCNLNTVKNFYSYKEVEVQASYAKKMTPLIEEIIKLTNKTEQKDRPVIEQFSSKDLSTFNIVNERMANISLQQLTESNFLRDIEFLERLIKVAYQNYKFNEIYDSKDSDYLIQNYLYILRAIDSKYPINNKSYDIDKTNQCSFNYSLREFQIEAGKKLESIDQSSLVKQIKDLANKYNMKEIDRTKLSKTDKDYLESLKDTQIIPLQKAIQLVDDIENIKQMSNVANLKYKSLKDDLNFSGGNTSYYGESLKKIRQSNQTDDRTKYILDIFELVSQNFPSEIAKQQAELARAAEIEQKKSINKLKPSI